MAATNAHVGKLAPVPDDVLQATYRFRHGCPVSAQTAHLCEQLRDLVVATIHELRVETDGEPFTTRSTKRRGFAADAQPPTDVARKVPTIDAFDGTEREFLCKMTSQWSTMSPSTIPRRGDVWVERWLPQLASVLRMACVNVGSAEESLIVMDGWTYHLHVLENGETMRSSVSTAHIDLMCGHLDLRARGAFEEELDAFLATLRDSEDARCPRHPSKLAKQVRLVVERAMDRHTSTGCRDHAAPAITAHDLDEYPRDTCWGLVRTVVKELLRGHSVLFDKVERRIVCRLIEDRLNCFTTRAMWMSSVPSSTPFF